MHIEKNICDNLLGTLLKLEGKTKDTVSSRIDLVAMGIQHKLHPYKEGHMVKLHQLGMSSSLHNELHFAST